MSQLVWKLLKLIFQSQDLDMTLKIKNINFLFKDSQTFLGLLQTFKTFFCMKNPFFTEQQEKFHLSFFL